MPLRQKPASCHDPFSRESARLPTTRRPRPGLNARTAAATFPARSPPARMTRVRSCESRDGVSQSDPSRTECPFRRSGLATLGIEHDTVGDPGDVPAAGGRADAPGLRPMTAQIRPENSSTKRFQNTRADRSVKLNYVGGQFIRHGRNVPARSVPEDSHVLDTGSGGIERSPTRLQRPLGRGLSARMTPTKPAPRRDASRASSTFVSPQNLIRTGVMLRGAADYRPPDSLRTPVSRRTACSGSKAAERNEPISTASAPCAATSSMLERLE